MRLLFGPGRGGRGGCLRRSGPRRGRAGRGGRSRPAGENPREEKRGDGSFQQAAELNFSHLILPLSVYLSPLSNYTHPCTKRFSMDR
ncbi:hypothetical protein MU1_44890 [Paenibacillus glycanilyticus]|uniref:Uncharacterized protein n=1 Tax=Paenibacillus glycanilyticus TaxID=126569 RepID=A0ABQ6GLA3_9BACL|nr:hypothetical protein MU1_44890 [Paenibacillus glycanilyticus]